MQLLNKREVRQLIGKAGMFQSFPYLADRLRYSNGSNGFDSIPSKNELGIVVSFNGHPEGIEMRANEVGEMIAVRYDSIKNYEITESELEDRYLLLFHTGERNPLVFNFLKAGFTDVMKYIREIGIEQLKEPRSKDLLKEQISSLKLGFTNSEDFSPDYSEVIKTAALGKTKSLRITKDEVSWHEETISVNEIIGISFGKTKNSVNGIKASMAYAIQVHKREGKSMKINFAASSIGGNEKTCERRYNTIIDILYNLITKRKICSWIDAFANDETVDFQEFKLNRKGFIIVTKKRGDRLIPWEDVTYEIFQLLLTIRSEYIEKDKVVMGLQGHPDANALLSFIDWIRGDYDRLKLLIG